jgi:hypothetical protein
MTAVLLTALLPVTAAVSAAPAERSPVQVALAQPLGALGPLAAVHRRVLPEPGLLMLIGGGLMGLGALVRRATRT